MLPDQMHRVLKSHLGRKHPKDRESEGQKVDLILGPHSLAERKL